MRGVGIFLLILGIALYVTNPPRAAHRAAIIQAAGPWIREAVPREMLSRVDDSMVQRAAERVVDQKMEYANYYLLSFGLIDGKRATIGVMGRIIGPPGERRRSQLDVMAAQWDSVNRIANQQP